MAREQLQTLSEPMYFILLALAKPMHGYEIMQTIASISNDCVHVGAGTLYALLARFEQEEIVLRIRDDGRRKTYALTEKGRWFLDREYERRKESIAAYDRYCAPGRTLDPDRRGRLSSDEEKNAALPLQDRVDNNV